MSSLFGFLTPIFDVVHRIFELLHFVFEVLSTVFEVLSTVFKANLLLLWTLYSSATTAASGISTLLYNVFFLLKAAINFIIALLWQIVNYSQLVYGLVCSFVHSLGHFLRQPFGFLLAYIENQIGLLNPVETLIKQPFGFIFTSLELFFSALISLPFKIVMACSGILMIPNNIVNFLPSRPRNVDIWNQTLLEDLLGIFKILLAFLLNVFLSIVIAACVVIGLSWLLKGFRTIARRYVPAEVVQAEEEPGRYLEESSTSESESVDSEEEPVAPVASTVFANRAKLERELSQERDRRLCVVCQDKEKNIIILPCKHACLCEPCGNHLLDHQPGYQRLCPICRTKITSIMNVYL